MINGRYVVYGGESLKQNGCNFYRIHQPMSAIIQKDIFPSALSNYLNFDEQTLWLEKCDILLSQIGMSQKMLDYVKETKRRKKYVLDFDDNPFEVSPYNPSYQFYGVEEVEYDVCGKKVYLRNGENGFFIEDNVKRLELLKEMMIAVHMIITPSPVLASVFKQFNDNVRIIRNFIDFESWYPIKMEKDDKIRIVWQGGYSHYEDWWEIKDVMREILDSYINVKLLIMGESFGGLFDGFDKNKIEFVKWCSTEVYPHKFKTLNADIGLAPLKNNKFNRCKSEIKWEEYSSLGIPVVASNVPPYSSAIKNDETGFLCSNPAEWKETLEWLIKDKTARKRVGENAMTDVKENYDLDKGVYEYEKVFKSLFRKELILI